jgi:hypothetical protein
MENLIIFNNIHFLSINCYQIGEMNNINGKHNKKTMIYNIKVCNKWKISGKYTL